MKQFFRSVSLVMILALFATANSYASMVSDAPAPYGTATHSTTEWQRLGDTQQDDGVSWSVNSGTFGNQSLVNVGDTIEFKFDMWSAGWGIHPYDQIKAWVDWNQDGSWNTSEQILAEQHFKPDALKSNFPNNDKAVITNFYSDLFTISENMIGDLWLRARVSCNHTSFEDTTPYGELWQGEVEDWFITANTASTPEPATLLLLGTGLVGLASFRQRKLFAK